MIQVIVSSEPKYKNTNVYDILIIEDNSKLAVVAEEVNHRFKFKSVTSLFLTDFDKDKIYPVKKYTSDISNQLYIIKEMLGNIVYRYDIVFNKDSLAVHRLDFIEVTNFQYNKEKIEVTLNSIFNIEYGLKDEDGNDLYDKKGNRLCVLR